VSWNLACICVNQRCFALSTYKLTLLLQLSLAENDTGVNISMIIEDLAPQGYSAGEVRTALNNLSNEGHVYSTIDEDHFSFAE